MGVDALRTCDWLLLPGTLCTTEVFAGFLDALNVPDAQRRSLTLDRGDVWDYADDLQASTRDTVICGFSLGALVAAHHADKIDAHRLILFGLNPLADDPQKAPKRQALAQDVQTMGGAAALAARLSGFAGAHPAKVMSLVETMADAQAPLISAQTQLALSRPGALPALGSARAPVVTVTGQTDHMAPPRLGQTAANTAPRGTFAELAGLGHYALLEDPVACAQAVRDAEDALA